jgi:hypothetical protein
MHDGVERVHASGERTLHVLEPAIAQARRRADRITASRLLGQLADGGGRFDGHRRAELRNLAYHRVLAERLDKPMVDDARHLLWRWEDQGAIDDRYAAHWEAILDLPVAEIRRIIGEDGERERDLRQNSPFAGMLSEPERRKLLAELC